MPPHEIPFDFHTHSTCSDGSDTPETLVCRAREIGIRFLALTDHDTMAGYPAAVQAGEEQGVRILPGVEMDTEFSQELHILGLGMNPDAPCLVKALESVRCRRNERNERMLTKLARAGYDVSAFVEAGGGTVTRMHVARALIAAGYAETLQEAFLRFLTEGGVGYVRGERLTPEQAIAVLTEAGGVAALAHPCHLRCDVHALVDRLCRAGLGGIEAYYPTSTAGQIKTFLSLAEQYGLYVTAGSDYHGRERPKNPLGSAWMDVPALNRTCAYFLSR